jgi:hypothetical protein
MTLDATLYAVIRWKQSIHRFNCSRYEVRPMTGLDADNRYEVVARDLTFKKAWDKKVELSSRQENNDGEQ